MSEGSPYKDLKDTYSDFFPPSRKEGEVKKITEGLRRDPLVFKYLPLQRKSISFLLGLWAFIGFFLVVWNAGRLSEYYHLTNPHFIGISAAVANLCYYGPLVKKALGSWNETLKKLRSIFKNDEKYNDYVEKVFKRFNSPFRSLFLVGGFIGGVINQYHFFINPPILGWWYLNPAGNACYLQNIFTAVHGTVYSGFVILLGTFIGETAWYLVSLIGSIYELSEYSEYFKVIHEPERRFGMRPIASTMLVISLMVLLIIAPNTIATISMWIVGGRIPPLWIVGAIGGYAFSFIIMFFPMFYLSKVAGSVKSRKLERIGKAIDAIERKIQEIEEVVIEGGSLEQRPLEDRLNILSELRNHHGFKIRQYKEIQQMKTNPMDITIVVKLLSAAGAPLVSLLLRYVLPFM